MIDGYAAITSNKKEALKIFHFAAETSISEWKATTYKNEKTIIGTLRQDSQAPSFTSIDDNIYKFENRMRRFYLALGILFFSTTSVIVLIANHNNNSSLTPKSKDLVRLIRNGFDLVDDTSFVSICNLLNDSLLDRPPVQIYAIPYVDLVDSTIDWSFIHMNYDEMPVMRDRLFLHMTLNGEGKLFIQNKSAYISDIQNLARDYIFYPDSSEWKITKTKQRFDQIGEIEISRVFIMLDVNIKKSNGFSVDEWKYFFSTLSELIKLCEDERSKMSLKLWKKDYNSLSFDKKQIVTEIIGYRTLITFF